MSLVEIGLDVAQQYDDWSQGKKKGRREQEDGPLYGSDGGVYGRPALRAGERSYRR
jgi:hypothetical protein